MARMPKFDLWINSQSYLAILSSKNSFTSLKVEQFEIILNFLLLNLYTIKSSIIPPSLLVITL